MPVTALDLKIQIRGTFLGQQMQVVQWYRPTGAAFLTADLIQVAEAYWNDIKTAWRACFVGTADDHTDSIFISEPGASGAYAEYAIPAGEQLGTRSATGLGDFMPPYVSAAIRETVGTRVTRPGQKRIWGSLEGDNANGLLSAGYRTIIQTVAPKFSGGITLGAPVATGVLWAEVVRLAGVPQTVIARQDVSGFIVSQYFTTQNSRKYGRGS